MKPSQAKTLYEMLGIPKNASSYEIDAAFRKRALIWHPDKNLDNATAADTEFKILLKAYGTLSNAEKRRDYDRYEFKNDIRADSNNYRNERLRAYREEQRTAINKMLKNNQRDFSIYNSLSRGSLIGMIVSVAWSIGVLLFPVLRFDGGTLAGLSSFFPFLFFNLCLICYMISKIEINDIRKRNRSLIIKLYAHVDE
jgi:hypothetical protein